MELILKNRLISADMITILDRLKIQLRKPLFAQISQKSHNLMTCCPIHKGGQEQHPSCCITTDKDSKYEYGFVHCFTCGYNASLPKMVADCFDESYDFGVKWLIDNFGDTIVESCSLLPPIVETKQRVAKKYLPEETLKQYNYYHPYMWKRGLTKEIVDKFQIGYDKITNSIVFPIRDSNGGLVGVTKRKVDTKYFYIDEHMQKVVYLLDYILKNKITTVYICESQLDALRLHTWGYAGVALLGTGCEEQYDILNKSGITTYFLCFDGDYAGRLGIQKFKKNIKDTALINVVQLPNGKDICDLTKEEFEKLRVY